MNLGDAWDKALNWNGRVLVTEDKGVGTGKEKDRNTPLPPGYQQQEQLPLVGVRRKGKRCLRALHIKELCEKCHSHPFR